jgi:hypothetical protein
LLLVMNIKRGPEPESADFLATPPELVGDESAGADPPSPQPARARMITQKLDAFRPAFVRVTGYSPKR